MRKVYLIIIAGFVLVLAAVVVRFLGTFYNIANSDISKAPPVHQSREAFFKNNTEYLVDPEYLVVGCDPFPTPGEDRLVPVSGEDPNLDCIASIDKPRFVSAKEADNFVSEEELVVGIDYKNKQKAYPIKNIFKHEVVNDKFGEDPILVTYCPLNGAAVVFERKVKNTALKFGVSGRLYNNDLVIYDRKRGSLWLQVTGQAIAGPLIR